MKRIGLAVALALAACNVDKQRAPENPEPVIVEEEEPAEPQPDCETLDRAECMRSRHCTMDWVKQNRYRCRASKGKCEVFLAQGDTRSCELRQGCEWQAGNCYCPFPGYGQTQVPDKKDNTGAACACGGGRPPRCKKKTTK